MSLNAALVLEPKLICRDRDPRSERAALMRVAACAGRYSSLLSLEPPDGVLLEVGGSLKLFGGLAALCEDLMADMDALGYQVILAVTPFPLAASLLSRAGRAVQIPEAAALPVHLAQVPIAVAGLERKTLAVLAEMGVRHFGELLDLPREGLRRRFGRELVELVERALGQRADLRKPFRAPPRFRARLELPAWAEDAQALLFAARRLLQELAGALRTARKGVEHLDIRLHHTGKSFTQLAVQLVTPSRDVSRWLGLLRERLDRLEIQAPVEVLELRADRFVPMDEVTGDLFADASRQGENCARLLERLQSRLGMEAVQGLELVADHRPERAWRFASPGSKTGGIRAVPRPLWLLSKPISIGAEASDNWRLTGPERIESGWWDGADVARDYYYAETPQGERLWVYRDRRNQGWFVHGFFS